MISRIAGFDARRVAGACWLSAALLYLGIEGLAAHAFTPSYSYSENYVSDLGVPVCGTTFDARAICSPFHSLMNANFFAQGVLFFLGGVVITCCLTTNLRSVFVAFAAINGVGNVLVGLFPETATTNTDFNVHVVGAVLAITSGNAAAFLSRWCFRELRLPTAHRRLSTMLPILAAVALAILGVARHSDAPLLFPDGVWERLSVYTITVWEFASAFACFRLQPMAIDRVD